MPEGRGKAGLLDVARPWVGLEADRGAGALRRSPACRCDASSEGDVISIARLWACRDPDRGSVG